MHSAGDGSGAAAHQSDGVGDVLEGEPLRLAEVVTVELVPVLDEPRALITVATSRVVLVVNLILARPVPFVVDVLANVVPSAKS